MPEETTPATPPASEAPRKVVTDLSQALVSEQPAPVAPPGRARPKQIPTDGTERLRDIGKEVEEEAEFLEVLYKELDGMRVADPDARRLKWVLQALIGRILQNIKPPPAKTEPAK